MCVRYWACAVSEQPRGSEALQGVGVEVLRCAGEEKKQHKVQNVMYYV